MDHSFHFTKHVIKDTCKTCKKIFLHFINLESPFAFCALPLSILLHFQLMYYPSILFDQWLCGIDFMYFNLTLLASASSEPILFNFTLLVKFIVHIRNRNPKFFDNGILTYCSLRTLFLISI